MAPQTWAGFEQFNNILACWSPSVLIDCQQYFIADGFSPRMFVLGSIIHLRNVSFVRPRTVSDFQCYSPSSNSSWRNIVKGGGGKENASLFLVKKHFQEPVPLRPHKGRVSKHATDNGTSGGQSLFVLISQQTESCDSKCLCNSKIKTQLRVVQD